MFSKAICLDNRPVLKECINMKREFKSFTNVIEQSMAEFKDKVKVEMQIIKGSVLLLTPKSNKTK